MKPARLCTFLFVSTLSLAAVFCRAGETSITDLFTQQEKQDAGLSKLALAERKALDKALVRVMARLTHASAQADSLSFFGADGKAVAYIDANDDLTIYLWSGKPVAYVDDDSIYGFNGNHLGWLKGGTIYDHDGDVIVANAASFKTSPTVASMKGLKELKPLKGVKELKPLKPLFGLSWSKSPAVVFLLKGVD